MTDIKHSSHRVENSFDSNYVGIFDQSESMLDATTSKGIVREDTQYDDPHSSELVDFDKERNPFSMGGDNLDDMPEIPSREIATPPKRYVADERTVQSFDDILQGDVRKRVFSVESELDQDRIDMEMAAIADNLNNRHMSFDDIGLDHSDLNPDDIDIDFRPQSDSESDELSYGKVDATKNSMPPPLGSTGESRHVLEEIQGHWTAADQSINVVGDSVIFNGTSRFQVFEMDTETLKLVMDDMDWWYKSNGNPTDEIIWVNLQDMRIKWTRVRHHQVPASKKPNLPPIEVTSPKTDITTDEDVVRAISDRRKNFTDPIIVDPPSAVTRVDSTNSTPQRTPRSARGQIDKLRSIIEAQKMEIQELQDKLKEKSSRETIHLQNEIDSLKRELKLRDDDVFHFKSAYQELKVQMEKQSRSLPLRSLSENRKVEDPYYNRYKGNNYLKPNKANSDLGNYSTQSEPNFARRSPKELQLARANVQLREKVAEKNDFIHRLLNIQEDGVARLLRDENSSLANESMSSMKADLDEMKKTKQDPVVSPNTTGHHRHASIGSFFEDKDDHRVNRLENEVLRLNQKINIIKHETQTNPRMKRTPPRPYREKKPSASADYEDKRNPYKKRSRPRSQNTTRTSHKRYRSLGSGKARSYTPHVHEITTTKSAPRHRSLTTERTSKSPASRSAPVKSFRIDVYEDSENGSTYQIESPERGVSAISNPERSSGMYRKKKTQPHKSDYKTEQKARINRIRKRFQKEQRKSKNYAASYQSSSPSKNWYVQSVA